MNAVQSRCLFRRDLGRGEFVFPGRHLFAIVMIPWVEARLEPGQPGFPADAEQGRLLPEEGLHGAICLFLRVAIGFQQLCGITGDIPGEIAGDDQHGHAAAVIALQRRPVFRRFEEDVIGNRLVLGLFHGVPAPQAFQCRIGLAEQRAVVGVQIHHQVCHHGGEVFQADRRHQHTEPAAFIGEFHFLADLSLDRVDRVFRPVDLVVQQVVLARVNGFLADEVLHILFQLAGDLILVGLHGIDEHALAIREGQRHGVEHGSGHGIAVQPRAIVGGGHVEMQVAGQNRYIFRRALGRHGARNLEEISGQQAYADK